MVAIYYIKWNESDIPAIMACTENLTPARQKKVQQFRQMDDRVRAVLGELLLRYARKRANKNFCEPTLDYYGKPHLPDDFFSLSHAGNIVAIAYGEQDVGVDVEQRQEHIEAYMHAFGPREQMLICTTPQELRKDRFIQLWTLKESCLKMIGTGFLSDPASISIEMHDNEFFVVPELGDNVNLTSIRFLYKGIIINHNKKPSQPTLKRRFFKKKAAFFFMARFGKGVVLT